MRRLIWAAALVLASAVGAARDARAASWEVIEAYKKGDFAEAARWFLRGAEQGNAVAQFNLGHAYERGEGVPVDKAAAEKWYEAAAEQGLAQAQLRLGLIAYEIKKDPKLAVKWFRPAAAQGLPVAQFTLGLMYELGTGVKRNEHTAARWYRVSAEHGYFGAQMQLAGLYERGAGVARDPKEAYFWYAVASRDPRNPERKKCEAALQRLGSNIGKDEAEAIKATANGWEPEAITAAATPPRGARPAAEHERDTGPRLYATGSGFYVSRSGHLLTNDHVVAGCREMRVTEGEKGVPVSVIATDRERDLALLHAPHPGQGVAVFRGEGAARLGESVVVVGFPLQGLLTTDPVVTSGIVSALAGPQNDHHLLQISAAAQPGNSGGPLFDSGGRIIGVVELKLDAMRVVKLTGALPENVNFAVKAEEAAAFLKAHGIDVETSSASKEKSVATIADEALKSTVRLECWH